MAGSLQEQLLRAGLTDKKKSQKIKQEKRKQAKIQRTQKRLDPNLTKESVQQAQAAKKARDLKLNLTAVELAEKKAVAHQIRQIIAMNKVHAKGGEIPFNFTHNDKIKRLYVTEKIQKNLQNGNLVIATEGDGYAIISTRAGDKISQRDDALVVYKANAVDAPAPSEEDNWYAEFKVPDDLMW